METLELQSRTLPILFQRLIPGPNFLGSEPRIQAGALEQAAKDGAGDFQKLKQSKKRLISIMLKRFLQIYWFTRLSLYLHYYNL